jgi:four helix bundle protein
MATYKKFEDLPVWQLSREFAAEAEKLIHESNIRTNYKLKDQMLSSSGSVMDNIAEGFDRNGNKEFRQFLYIAKGSATEFKSQLYRALDSGRISSTQFEEGYERADRISKEIGGLIKYLSGCDLRGSKYK